MSGADLQRGHTRAGSTTVPGAGCLDSGRIADTAVERFGTALERFDTELERFAGAAVKRFAGAAVERFAGAAVERFAGAAVLRLLRWRGSAGLIAAELVSAAGGGVPRTLPTSCST